MRRATPDDLEIVTALRTALLLEDARHRPSRSHARAERCARETTEAQLADAERHPRRQVLFLAGQGSRAVGLLRCVAARSSSLARPGRYALVTTVFVRPAQRRRGVLRTLLRAADAWARTARLPEMRLHCALQNRIGNAAWAALGFTPLEILHRRIVPPEAAAR